MKTLLRLTTALGISCALPASSFACATCFGAVGDPVVEAVGWAILFLLGFVACLLGGILAFCLTLAKRSRLYRQQLQEGEAEWAPLSGVNETSA